jgi:hypothetical protein
MEVVPHTIDHIGNILRMPNCSLKGLEHKDHRRESPTSKHSSGLSVQNIDLQPYVKDNDEMPWTS